ncbi:hypothetical protein BGW80DRAFT_1299073 [Lactifluus volemus]|nr:hypothetical protein BGW80DRAFT_1299073 [Lactifluus volemus]
MTLGKERDPLGTIAKGATRHFKSYGLSERGDHSRLALPTFLDSSGVQSLSAKYIVDRFYSKKNTPNYTTVTKSPVQTK